MSVKKEAPDNLEDVGLEYENEQVYKKTIVKVKPIPNEPGQIIGFGYEKHGYSLAPGVVYRIRALYNKSTGKRDTGLEINIPNPNYDKVHDKRETILYRELMEQKLGNRHDLKPESPFWDEFVVRLENKTNVFNIEVPEDEMRVALMKVSRDVLPSLNERSNPRYLGAKFVFDDPEIEAESKLYKQEIKRKAFKKFDELTASERAKITRILQIIPMTGLNDRVIESRLFDFVESNPKDFLAAANKDKELLNVEAIVYEAIDFNVLRKKDGRIIKVSGDKEGAVIGSDYQSAVNFLMLKNSSDILAQITKEIQAKKTV